MIGTNIGNYQIVSQIGEGGMGVVYLARHATLGRRAAVKVLLPQLSNNRDHVARFFNEARAATAVQHPGIVEIHDFGFLPDASAFIIMEFLDGESLASRLRATVRTPAERALSLVRQIAGPLRAAHDRGIVHRDLKPDNIFLVRDPEMPGGERIKLLDFGIAKLAAEIGDTGSRTRTGAVLGTPTYMAPEQCRGAGTVDLRADLYALGCILYEMLCGRPPFMAEGAGDVIAHHLYFAPQPPSQLEPSIPPAVEQLTLRLLEKDPQRRPQTASELLAMIEQIVSSGGATTTASATPSAAPARQQTWDPATSPPSVTTLSHASGPLPTGMPAGGGPRRRWLIPAVAGTIVVAGLAVVVAMSSGGGQQSAEPMTPAAAFLEPDEQPVAAAPVPVAPAAAPVEPPPPPPPPPEAAPVIVPVKLTIASTPSGAEVLFDGKVVGTTPFAQELAPAAGKRTYSVRAKGYSTRKVTLSTDANDHEHVELKKRRDPALGNDGVNPFE